MGILGTLTGAIPPIAPLGVGFGLISGILGMIGDEKELYASAKTRITMYANDRPLQTRPNRANRRDTV
jgi:hypothetical protein